MIVAGIGYRQAATVADLRDALALTRTIPHALASTSTKAQGAAMQALADELDLPIIAVSEHQLAGVKTMTQSLRVKTRFQTGSLAEAAALVAAGEHEAEAQITVPRVQSTNGMATAAIAERKAP